MPPPTKPRLPCRVCGKPGRKVGNVYCSREHWRLDTPNRLNAGIFQPNQSAHNRLPVGSVTVRSFKRDGRQRAFIKIAEPNRWRERAKVVWEEHNGPIPRGKLIHHKDRNTLNDDIDNLDCLTRAEHLAEHRAEVR